MRVREIEWRERDGEEGESNGLGFEGRTIQTG